MKAFHIDEGWIMIILLSCLGLALTFVNFGLGLVSLAQAQEPAREPDRPKPDHLDAALEQARQQARQLQGEIDYWRREVEQRREQAARQEQAREQARASLAEARARLGAVRTRTQVLQGEVADKSSRHAAQQARRQHSEQQRAAAAARAAALRQQFAQAEQKERELRQQIADKDLVDPGQIFGGKGSGKKPQWVECHRDGVTLQPQAVVLSVAQLQGTRDVFRKALGAQRYVVFLIRPSGIAAFKAARAAIEGRGFELGFEPVDEKWRFRYEVRGNRL